MPPSKEAEQLLKLADRDLAVFQAIKDVSGIHLSSICFHAQQCVEKSLKAVLVTHGVIFRRTHDLIALAELLIDKKIAMPVALSELGKLNPYAVTFRYDDMDIETITSEEAATIVKTIRHWAGEQVR